jgi:site-specific DNA-cytosine methylase
VVIAHPPCSAFSLMNNVPSAQGVDSEAFACTVRVLQYAMGNNAQAIAVESVPGALAGAWHVHQEFADTHGYHLYRVMQNGIAFGAPQWRDRFWAVFVKKGLAPETLRLVLTPTWTRIRDVVEGHEDGPTYRQLDRQLEKVTETLRPELNDEEWEQIFGPNPSYFGPIIKSVHRLKFSDEDYETVQWRLHGFYGSGQFYVLDPNGYTPVLLGASMWRLNGRNLSIDAHKRIMGFPADYVFPVGRRDFLEQSRMFLSKGVIPYVSRWILDTMRDHLEGRRPEGQWEVECDPDYIADFRVKKKAWERYWETGEQPEVRQWER